MEKQAKKVLAVLEDLLFTVKIHDAAKRTGMQVQFVKTELDALEAARAEPSVIIVDLNCSAAEPLQLIAKLKASPELKGISIIGFVSHVQGELKQKAQESGCDMVMARSAFSQNVQQILRRHSGVMI